MKPNNFPVRPSLNGTEELYTQTGGLSQKFTLEQAKNFIGGLAGTNYIFVSADGTPSENAQKLQDAYNKAIILSPTTDNRITILLANGYYNFSQDFEVTEDYIDLVSLDGNRSVIFSGTGTINVKTNNVFIKGINVLEKEFKISTNLNSIIIENCKGGNKSFGYEVNVSGKFINCQGGNYSFGGLGDASGYFKDCQSGNFSFGGGGVSSGIFEDCKSGNYSFGGQGIANGTYTRCLADIGSFGDEEFLGNMSFCELKSGIYPPINFIEGNENNILSCPAELPEGLTEEQLLTGVVGQENVKYYELFDKDFTDCGYEVNPVEELLNLLKIFYFADPTCLINQGNIITPNASIKASIDGLGLFYPQIGKFSYSINSELLWNTSANGQLISQLQFLYQQIQAQAAPIIGQLTLDLQSHIGDVLPLILQALGQLQGLNNGGEALLLSSSLPEGMTEEEVIQQFGFTDIWSLILLFDGIEDFENPLQPNENLSTTFIELFNGQIILDNKITAYSNTYSDIFYQQEPPNVQFFIDFDNLILELSEINNILPEVNIFALIEEQINLVKGQLIINMEQILIQFQAILQNENISPSVTLPPAMTEEEVLTIFNLLNNWEIIGYFGGQNYTNELLSYLNGIIIYANDNQLDIQQLIQDLGIDQWVAVFEQLIAQTSQIYIQFNQPLFVIQQNQALAIIIGQLTSDLQNHLCDALPLILQVISQLTNLIQNP